MSSFAENAEGGFKKVLRAAFVEVESTDQTIIKSYLQILLRLEADVEWVLDDHLQIDLLMVGDESRDSASINKIISNRQCQSVLYVSRNNMSTGSLTEDTLVLPLRKLDTFYDWLITSVPKLMKGTEAANDVSKHQGTLNIDSSEQSPISTAKMMPSNIAHSSNSLDTISDQVNTGAIDARFSKEVDNQVSEFQGIIDFIKKLQQRPTGLYHIITPTQTIAIVEPSRARVWLLETNKSGMSPAINLEWQLTPYNGTHPTDSQPKDLMQWLSQCNGLHILVPLISNNKSYRLRFWIKPATIVINNSIGNAASYEKLAGDERRELLQVMTALESAPRDIAQLARLTEMPINSAKKILASLLFSGSLQPESYVQLSGQPGDTINSPALPINEDDTAVISSASVVSQTNNTAQATGSNVKQTTLEALLERRAQGEVAATMTSSAEIVFNKGATKPSKPVLSIPPSAAVDSAQQEKRGFLSRLRQKLGL